MPRKAKMFKTNRREAASLWRKGKHKEANELWEKVAGDKLAHRESKRSRKSTKQ